MEEENNYEDIYEIIGKPIGIGASASVYKAKVKGEEKYVAIKVIDKESIKNGLRQAYFKEDINKEYLKIEQGIIREIEFMKKCAVNNNNSIKIFDSYNTEKEIAIVMELCDDNLMNLLIRREKGFSLNEIYDILIQLNKAFKIMTNKKIAHRDLKPQNILIKYNNKEKTDFTLKIADYGISRTYSNNEQFETNIGTPDYIAPEILEGKKYDYKCDLWSLGIIIHMLHFKKNPFNPSRQCSQKTILVNINLGPKMLLKSGNRDFDNLIKGLLTKDPKYRLSWKQYFNHDFFTKRTLEIKENKNNEKQELIKENNKNIIDAENVNLNKYENSYDDGSFWKTIKKYGVKIGLKPVYIAFLLYYSLSKASILNKAIIVGSLGYLISPLDLIPDYIPYIGLLDDISVLMFAYYRVYTIIDDEIRQKAKSSLKGIFGNNFDENVIKDL